MKELENIKNILSNYEKQIIESNNLRYENNKLIRTTKVGEKIEKNKPIRSTDNYKIYADHFDCALPYTHYYIASIKTGKVYEIPEVITAWNHGVLKEITDNLKAGRDLNKIEITEEEKAYFKNMFI